MRKIIFVLLLLCSSVSGQTYSYFGYQTVGFTNTNFLTTRTYQLNHADDMYTASEGDIVDSFYYYVGTSDTDTLEVALYKFATDTTLEYRDTITTNSATGWIAIQVDNNAPWTLEAGSKYGIAIRHVSNTIGKYNSSLGNGRQAFSVLPDPWATSSIGAFRYSSYVAYYNDPGGVTKFHKHSEEGNGVLHSSNGSSPRHKSE